MNFATDNHFRPVEVRGAFFDDHDLRVFETPKTWREIRVLWPLRSEAWLRDAVIDADEYGRDLIAWNKTLKLWVLSDGGRARLGLPPKEEESCPASSRSEAAATK